MIIKEQDWKNWNSHYKVCYYPYFLYTLPIYDSHEYDALDIDDEVRNHLARIKTFLLYFDYVTLPISTLIKPRNPFAKGIFEGLLKNKHFIRLYEEHLVISTLYKNEDVNATFLKRAEYLDEIKWKTTTTLYQDQLVHELNSFLLYEVNVSVQVDLVRNQFLEKASSIVDPALRKKLAKIIAQAESNSKFPFSHEKFSQLVFNKNDKDITSFLYSTNTIYFEASELGNPGSVMPYMSDVTQADKLNRRSFNSKAYSVLYSTDFFLEFLSWFIDKNLLKRIVLLDAKTIDSLRHLECWRVFISEYHRNLEQLTERLDQFPAQEIKSQSLESIRRKLLPKNPPICIDVLLACLYGIANKLFFKLETIQEFKEMAERLKVTASLRFENKAIYDYVQNLKSELRKLK